MLTSAASTTVLKDTHACCTRTNRAEEAELRFLEIKSLSGYLLLMVRATRGAGGVPKVSNGGVVGIHP